MSRVGPLVAPPVGFRRHSLTGWGLFFFAVSASAPMTVLVGGIVGAFAVTDVVAVPAAFILLTMVLWLVSVGYVSMARYVRHSGPLYAHVAQGLGPVQGVSAAAVVLLSYNAIQCCLYGLLGQTMSDFGMGPWWAWALATWALVAVFGIGQVTLTAKALAILLGVELLVVACFVAFALANPVGGRLDPGPLWPGHLFGDGVGSVFALAVACFVGVETALAFGEEAVSHRALARASYGSLLFLGALYTLAGWAVTAATGPSNVGQAASTDGVGIVFGVLHTHLGLLGLVSAQIFLATSIFAAMLSFHQSVARYLFVMSRERLVPARLGRVGPRTGAPIGGSFVQSGVALIVIVGCAVLGIDPMTLFFVLAALAAVGIMSLLAVNGWAAWNFFNRRQGGPGTVPMRLKVVPLLGTAAMVGVVGTTVGNLHAMTGAAPGSWQVWLLPAIVAVVGAAGLIWGCAVYVRHRDIAAGIGRGETEPLAVLEHHLIPYGSRL